MYIAWLGLSLIIVGWVIQLIKTLQKDHKIQPWYIIVQTIGVLLLVIGSWNADRVLALLNAGSAAAAISVLIALKR